jgi:hypothetical protein
MEVPDILKLQEALQVEVNHGFVNLRGKKFYFADFLALAYPQDLN